MWPVNSPVILSNANDDVCTKVDSGAKNQHPTGPRACTNTPKLLQLTTYIENP